MTHENVEIVRRAFEAFNRGAIPMRRSRTWTPTS
jgi:hypothetical protein